MIKTVKETLLESWVRQYEQDPHFVAEGLATDTIEQVITKLEECKGTQSWLAEAMHVNRQQISQMFNAPPNLTLLSIARLAIALGTKPKILFDSEAYSIRSLNEPYDAEGFAGERATYQQKQPSTNDASRMMPIGEPLYGTAG